MFMSKNIVNFENMKEIPRTCNWCTTISSIKIEDNIYFLPSRENLKDWFTTNCKSYSA